MRDLTQELVEALLKRRERGISTYGVPVDPDVESVEFWLKEAISEQLDGAIYNMAALETVQKLRLRVTELEEELVAAKETITELERENRQYRLKQAMKEDVDTLHRIIQQQTEGK